MTENTQINTKSILDVAAEIISSRAKGEYINTTQSESFDRIADLWNAYLGTLLNKYDVANMLVLLKISRAKNGLIISGKPQIDSVVDIAGYAGCMGIMLEEDRPADKLTDEDPF